MTAPRETDDARWAAVCAAVDEIRERLDALIAKDEALVREGDRVVAARKAVEHGR